MAARELTIEQLAAAAGLPVSTIRMYQHRALVPPPERRGRVGIYGEAHLARLRLIGQLQDRGYSLAAIKDLVDTWQEGRGLDEVLGLERAAAGVIDDTEPVRLRPEELARRFEGVELTPPAMARAQDLGLVALGGDGMVVTAPTFLEVGSALATMGIPVDEILDEYEHLQGVTAELAERFAGLFETHLWASFVEAGMPAGDVTRLTDDLARLGPLAEQIVTATLRQALRTTATRFLDEQADALGTALDDSASDS